MKTVEQLYDWNQDPCVGTGVKYHYIFNRGKSKVRIFNRGIREDIHNDKQFPTNIFPNQVNDGDVDKKTGSTTKKPATNKSTTIRSTTTPTNISYCIGQGGWTFKVYNQSNWAVQVLKQNGR